MISLKRAYIIRAHQPVTTLAQALAMELNGYPFDLHPLLNAAMQAESDLGDLVRTCALLGHALNADAADELIRTQVKEFSAYLDHLRQQDEANKVEHPRDFARAVFTDSSQSILQASVLQHLLGECKDLKVYLIKVTDDPHRKDAIVDYLIERCKPITILTVGEHVSLVDQIKNITERLPISAVALHTLHCGA